MHTTQDIVVIGGILERTLEDFLARAELLAPHLEWIQVDIADNSLVSNETFLEFVKLKNEARWKKLLDTASFEAHLMVDKPVDYIQDLIDAGFSRIIAHVECRDPREFLEEAMSYDCEVGLAIDADSEIELLEPFIEEVDVIQIMTIDAGFSGQPFRADAVEKIRSIHREYPELPISVDGHVNKETAKIVKDAGATRLMSTTYITQDPEHIEKAVQDLIEA